MKSKRKLTPAEWALLHWLWRVAEVDRDRWVDCWVARYEITTAVSVSDATYAALLHAGFIERCPHTLSWWRITAAGRRILSGGAS